MGLVAFSVLITRYARRPNVAQTFAVCGPNGGSQGEGVGAAYLSLECGHQPLNLRLLSRILASGPALSAHAGREHRIAAWRGSRCCLLAILSTTCCSCCGPRLSLQRRRPPHLDLAQQRRVGRSATDRTYTAEEKGEQQEGRSSIAERRAEEATRRRSSPQEERGGEALSP